MNLLFTTGIAIIASVATFLGAYNFLPLGFFEPESTYGSTITTILGTDTLSASRTTINNNFAALNSTKIENSTTSVAAITTLANLATVGTITSGVWSGTAILASKGGTGSTTLSANQVLLGNGTGNIGVVSGYGTSGQFLTSNGSPNAPTWTSGAVDTTANYNWTGTNLFKNLNASSTVANPIVLNGVSINTPSTQGASSTVMSNNGSGTFYNVPLPWINIGESSFSGTATSTLTLTSTTTVRDLKVVVRGLASGSACSLKLQLNPNTTAGRANNYTWTTNLNVAAVVSVGNTNVLWLTLGTGGLTTATEFYGVINIANDVSSNKLLNWIVSESQDVATGLSGYKGQGAFYSTTDQIKSLAVGVGCTSGAGTMTSGRVSVYASQN